MKSAQLTRHKTEQKVQYEIPKVVCQQTSLQLLTKAYVLTASKIAHERLGLPAKYFNKKHVGRVELDVLKPKLPDGNKRVANIVGQIKGTAAFIKAGIAKEIKLCLVDPSTEEVKEVYKFSAKELMNNNDDQMNAVMKQKRLLETVEGFFREIDTAMIHFKGKPKKLGLVTIVDFLPGTNTDSVKQEFFEPTDKDIKVTKGVKTKLGELSTDYHRMKVVAITAIENTTL